MVSNSSKALPYISIAVTFGMVLLNALGYVNVDAIVAALPILAGTAVGGLYNAKVQAQVEQYRILSASPEVKALVDEIKAKIPATPPTPT